MLIDPNSLIEQTVNRRYYVREIIGQGGMGTVYLVWDLIHKREYALKLLLPPGASDLTTQAYQELRERFRREQKLLTKLHHEHIPQIYETGEYRDAAYFIMEYFPYGSLLKKIQTQGKLSLQDACQYIKQVASALDYIHQHKIIHRDIKPQNMLLDSHNQLMLADFGVARIAGSLLTSSEQPGTRVYKSPEARNDEKPDRRDDIYSLGVVLYEMLTGNHPSSAQRNLEDDDIPPEVRSIILKAMAKRSKRYNSALEMAKDLEKAINRMRRANKSQSAPPWRQFLDRNYFAARTFSSINTPIRAKKQRKYESLFGFGLLLAILLLSFFVIHEIAIYRSANSFTLYSSTTSFEGTPGPSSQQQALATVQQYYSDWNNRNYQEAYSLLQPSYQQRYSYASLLPSYQHTYYTCITITGTELLPDGTVQITVTDNAIEDSLSEGTVVNLYHIVYSVIQINNIWRLAPISLQRETASGVCNK